MPGNNCAFPTLKKKPTNVKTGVLCGLSRGQGLSKTTYGQFFFNFARTQCLFFFLSFNIFKLFKNELKSICIQNF